MAKCICGERYNAFRTGLSFAEVRAQLRAEPERKHVTRHTVLGRWHELKVMLWTERHAYCEAHFTNNQGDQAHA